MTEENQRKQPEGMGQPDPALVSTVTAAVLQTLQATGTIPGSDNSQEKPKPEPKTIDLIGLFFHILEKFWAVLVSAIVCAVLMGVLAGNSVTTYSATSKLYIVNPNSTGVNIADLQLGTVLTLDYQEVFKTWEVHEMVIEELDLPYTYEQMQSMLTISNPEETRILYITVSYPDAQMAADIANAYAKAAKTFIINTMKGEEPSDFSIALEPSVGYGVSRSSSIIVGFLVGSVLSVAVLALFYVLDNRPRSPESIQQYGGIPTLAVFPEGKDGKYSGKFDTKKPDTDEAMPQKGRFVKITNFPKSDFISQEAMNTLCTNLSYCGKDIRKILITSRYASEGKSYVSMNLMRTLAQLGRRVVLIDTDLRASGIQSEYRLCYNTQMHSGLTEFLSDMCELGEVFYSTNIPNAWIIPAGHEAPNPLQLLDTERMEQLIETLAENYDVVLVDTPPIGVVSDAVAMAKFCDGALLVVGYQKGKQQEISDAVAQIKKTGCKMLGAVLNGVKFKSISNRHYYYNSERYSAHYSKRYYDRNKK